MVKSEKGFTLIEVLITTAILLVMVLSLYTFLVSGLLSSVKGEGKARAVQTARFAMDGELDNPQNPGLIDELRLASNINSADEDSIEFDISDSAGVVINTIDYSYVAATTGSIERTDAAGIPVTIVDHILDPDGLHFTYFDSNGDTLSAVPTPADIRQVQVEIKVDINGDGQADAALKTRVVPRNIP
ncbi:MAG: prepilin-type N-terminal cleavage/methylation domain-containing protein [bacterium]|nr:prepilin-type N-terminal cleavage/methylation domain-containing protein [bacterium]